MPSGGLVPANEAKSLRPLVMMVMMGPHGTSPKGSIHPKLILCSFLVFTLSFNYHGHEKEVFPQV